MFNVVDKRVNIKDFHLVHGCILGYNAFEGGKGEREVFLGSSHA